MPNASSDYRQLLSKWHFCQKKIIKIRSCV